MTAYAARFPILSRLLHWLMAAMILAMLFIGIGMVATVSKRYELLVSIHRPLGIAILILVVVRLVNRCLNPPPALPDTVPPVQRWAAKASHIVLYASMVAMPLVGWGMLSAERYPIVLYGPLQLPSILPHICVVAIPAHLSRLFALLHVPRPFRCSPFPRPDPPRWSVREYGVMA